MQIVQAPRASAILYSLLKSQADVRPWLLPANICSIVPITFLKAGVPFELVDISAETLHMDLEQAEAEIRKRRIGGVLYAHMYGEPSTPDEFFCQVKAMDETVMLVDDRCLCIPELEPETDSAADVQLFSTGYAKIVDLGSGGFAFIKEGIPYQPFHLPFDAQAYQRIEKAYDHAIRNRVLFEYQDCDWLQTDARLPAWDVYRQRIGVGLEESMHQRARLNEIYASRLPQEIQLPEAYQTWRFNIRVENKERVLDAIFKAGLFASSHYASLGGVMSANRCVEAEKFHAGVINLFNDRYFDEAKAEKVCEIVLENLS